MSAGQIYDLGYKRYLGSRRSFETRWLVIMRHQIATAWKGWWRFKLWFIAGLLATAISGGVMIVARQEIFRGLAGISGQLIMVADALLPFSMTWYCPIGFFASLLLCSTTVAGDLQSGAFTFYFARSVRPRDYVIGKLAGLSITLLFVMMLGPVVLAGLRLGLADDLHDFLGLLPLMSKALVIGALGTLAYAAVPLGFSAIVANRRYAMALWAAYYIVFGSMLGGLAFVTNPALGALDLATAVKAVSFNLFDVHGRGRNLDIPMSAAVISIAGHVAVAIGLVFWRVRNAQRTGVGGSS